MDVIITSKLLTREFKQVGVLGINITCCDGIYCCFHSPQDSGGYFSSQCHSAVFLLKSQKVYCSQEFHYIFNIQNII